MLLRECESISAALSCILTHFDVPPRTVWYDNGCNLYDSACIRIPWLLRWTWLVVDRFHYTGHNCSNIFNADAHRSLDADRSVAAEVINSLIDNGVAHITFLEGRNVMPFMKAVFAYINAAAHIRDKLRRDDLEDEDILHQFRERFRCVSRCCVVIGDDGNDDSQPEQEFPDGIDVFSRRAER